MKQSLQLLKRDLLRIWAVRKAWVVVIGVLITPALYAWFNIAAFWDPYGNTSQLQVAVANLDQGATSELAGTLNVGEQVVGQLEGNDQLGWQFMSEAEARGAVESGKAYAAIIIPANFSADLLSITTKEFRQPTLDYLVNEKANAVAPKITDVGAVTLDQQISETFISQVAQATTEQIQETGESLELKLLNAKNNTLTTFADTATKLTQAQVMLGDLENDITAVRQTLSESKTTLSLVKTELQDVQTLLTQTQGVLDTAQIQILTFTDLTTSAYLQGTTLLADVTGKMNSSISAVTATITTTTDRIDTAIATVTQLISANTEAIGKIQEVVNTSLLPPDLEAKLNDLLQQLQAKNAQDQELLTHLGQLNADLATTVSAVQQGADAFAGATVTTQKAADQLRADLLASGPELSSAMSALSASTASLGVALGGQQTQITQAQDLLAGIDNQLASTIDALIALRANLGDINTGVETARTDLLTLGAATHWQQLQTIIGLDPEQIATFMASPVQVNDHALFPIETYGSAMAALFTNLSLWIGAFMLMVIFKAEVDKENLPNLSVRTAYFGRFYLFALLGICQALVVSSGNLILGVQTVNAAAFIATAILVSIAYVSIIYGLTVAFGHIGRGICILLVIMQIPGASGLYPIEMMPQFFQNIYPFLPFTYGIGSMRETIGGFSGNHYWVMLRMLLIFVVLAFILGITVRRHLASFHLVFNREINASRLLIGENVEVTGRRYRFTDLIQALASQEEFGDKINTRIEFFTRNYRKLITAIVATGVGGIVIITTISHFTEIDKAAILATGLIWCLLVISVLATIEYFNRSWSLAAEVSELAEPELKHALTSAQEERS